MEIELNKHNSAEARPGLFAQFPQKLMAHLNSNQ